MKKFIVVLLCFVLSLTLASCGKDASSKVSSTTKSSLDVSSESNIIQSQTETKSKTSEESSSESLVLSSDEENLISSSSKLEVQTFTLTPEIATFSYGSVSTVTVSNILFEYVTAQTINKDSVDYISLGIGKDMSDGSVRPSGYLETKTAIETMKTLKIRELMNGYWTGDILIEGSIDGVEFTTIEATSRLEVSDGVGVNPQRINYEYNLEGFKYVRISQAADKFGAEYSVNIESLIIEY